MRIDGGNIEYRIEYRFRKGFDDILLFFSVSLGKTK